MNKPIAPMSRRRFVQAGPAGKDHVSDVTAVNIEPAGDGEEGFARYRFKLEG